MGTPMGDGNHHHDRADGAVDARADGTADAAPGITADGTADAVPGITADGIARAGQPRRRLLAWDPGTDTLIALGTLLGFWACYWAGTTLHPAFLYTGILVLGTAVPAWSVLRRRREGLPGLGLTRHRLRLALILSAVLGAGSVYKVVALAHEQDVALLPHLLGNLVVLWEPLFVFGWLYLRWERAFGVLPAIVLVGAGFALQHVGSVPLGAAIFFGMFALVFAVLFALVRNLLVLRPLFYPVASGIGTLQAGFQMGWDDVLIGAAAMLAQVLILVAVARSLSRAGQAGAPGAR